MTKRVLSIVLTLVLLLSMTTSAFAATGKTVTFNGGHIYQNVKGKPGTIQVSLSNISKKKSNVKISEKELMTYVDDDTVADTVISYAEDGDAVTVQDIVTNKSGVTVYYANSKTVTVTAKSVLNCFWVSYKGNVVKTKYTPKYYSFNDYLINPTKAKILTTPPEDDYLIAPGTTMKLNKPGKYLFVLQDDGMISESPVSAFCVIINK
jgi:hypothetical protein